MLPTFICVDATVDGRKVGGDHGVFKTIADADKRTCHQLLLAFLKDNGLGDAHVALPKGSTVVLHYVKMCDARLYGGHPTADIGLIQDCFVFFSFPVTITMAKVPTKTFSFVCTRHVEARPPPSNPMVFTMAHFLSAHLHLPRAREYRKMTGKDILFNDLRDYQKEQRVDFPADIASSVGDEFLSNLSNVFFSLSSKVWKALNDAHNRGGAAPEQNNSSFFGRRAYSKKADRPKYSQVLQHIQKVWIGTHDIVKKVI